jgi:hypothetical protein
MGSSFLEVNHPQFQPFAIGKKNKSDSAYRLVCIAKNRLAGNRPKDDFFSI